MELNLSAAGSAAGAGVGCEGAKILLVGPPVVDFSLVDAKGVDGACEAAVGADAVVLVPKIEVGSFAVESGSGVLVPEPNPVNVGFGVSALKREALGFGVAAFSLVLAPKPKIDELGLGVADVSVAPSELKMEDPDVPWGLGVDAGSAALNPVPNSELLGLGVELWSAEAVGKPNGLDLGVAAVSAELLPAPKIDVVGCGMDAVSAGLAPKLKGEAAGFSGVAAGCVVVPPNWNKPAAGVSALGAVLGAGVLFPNLNGELAGAWTSSLEASFC